MSHITPENPWTELLTGEAPEVAPVTNKPCKPARAVRRDQKPTGWLARGRVVPTWLARDLKRLRAWLANPEQNAQWITHGRERIEAQFAAFIAAKELPKPRTVERIIALEVDYAALIGRPSNTTALTALLARVRPPERGALPWDTRGRHVPTWALRAVDVYRRSMERLAKVEKAAQAGDRRSANKVERLRAKVVAARERAETIIAAGAEQAHGETAKAKFTHFRRVMRDALAGYAATSGCSFANESFEELLDRHSGLLHSVVNQARQRREVEDLEQQARTALLESAAKYRMDHVQQAKLTTVAVWDMKRACETRAAGPAKPGMYIQNNQERLLSSLDAPLDKAEPGEGTRAKILASSKGADVDTVLTVRDALAQLDELERAIAVASFIEGRRAPEIAELLGRSEEEIRKLRRTVRDKLTVMLGGLNG